ncbi:Na+/H+ antiporter NhaC [Haladaptatus salinisoli]|uniref:arginine/ornithine antiporter ArcD n=1 Tax=Haladaptatus salinisoli TaxID=2884876 RepID=UPI001D0A2D9E|nr:Na+/H+ antiporter NhaC [Haladaptatus salinisoli]
MVKLTFEPRSFDDIVPERQPTLGQALTPVIGMVLFLGVGAIALDLDPQMPLIWSIALTGLVGRYWLNIPWAEMYEGIVDGLRMGMQAILILFVIYMLIATLTAAGTIPAIIYYGLEVLTPGVFLPLTAIFAVIIAFTIGSSWTTAGTLGVAFMGIGAGLGVPAPMTAGAILTGAYTGDKVSPLSDTTNLAAAVTNTELMTHVRTMRVGTGIAFVLSLLGYIALGFQFTGSIPLNQVETIQTAIMQNYSVTPIVFLPLLITFAFALYGYPALPSLGAGVFASVGTMLLAQGISFTKAWDIAQNGAAPQTGTKVVNELLATTGLIGSSWTITIVAAALALGGLLERTGILAALAYHMRRIISGTSSLTIGTGLSAITMNILTAEQYMSIVIPGMTLRGLYNEYDLENRNLSRAVEAAGTTTSALIPWNAGGVYMAGVLGVPTLTYAPYYFLGFLSPLILFAMGLTGWRITHRDTTTESSTNAQTSSPTDD